MSRQIDLDEREADLLYLLLNARLMVRDKSSKDCQKAITLRDKIYPLISDDLKSLYNNQ